MKTTLKLAAVTGLLALVFVASMRSTTATVQPLLSDSVATGADTSNEERVIGKYLDDLFAYQLECYQTSKRQALRNGDLDPLQRKSDDLQSRLSEVQNAARDIINKFKATNEFDDLDSKFLARVNDPRQRSFFQESSLKADLEYAAGSLSSHREEIGLPLAGLRRKVAANTNGNSSGTVPLVMAAYHPPVAMGMGLGCRLGQIKLKLIQKNGGNIGNSPATCNAITCACGKGPLCPGECPGGSATQ